MKRIMIAGTHSGCGKTTVTCAVLQALVNRKIDVASFKCGPDYIDTMFHSQAIGIKSHNLDNWLCDEKTINYLLYKNAGEISVIEGVMGFYDGVNRIASSCGTAISTSTPVIIVIDCKGMSSSIGAVMKGYLSFITPNNICGFIYNRLPESLVPEVIEICRDLKTEYLGRFPYDRECSFESRHLGLVTADDISDIKEKLYKLSEYAEKNINIDRIIEIAEDSVKKESVKSFIPDVCSKIPVRIAVASDKAFCFEYEDNIELLRQLGAEIVNFSPINGKSLPDNISGLILWGGYPELYADELSKNTCMLEQIRRAVEIKIPIIAECGGFMYLHESMELENKIFKMVGAIDGSVYNTNKLRRFGYKYLIAEADNMLCKKGEKIKAHEFHYWDSTNCGSDFTAVTVRNNDRTKAVHGNEHSYMGFPHLYFYSDIKIAENFVRACIKYRSEHEKD